MSAAASPSARKRRRRRSAKKKAVKEAGPEPAPPAESEPVPPSPPKSVAVAPASIDNRTRTARGLVERVGATAVEREPSLSLRAALSLVVVTCNDSALVGRRLDQLCQQVTAIDTRWWVLDLGSVDDSIAVAQQRRAGVVAVPGGRVRPLEALDKAMEGCGGDLVVFVDAGCADVSSIPKLVAHVRQGAWLAGPDSRRPGLVVVSREAWQKQAFAGSFDLRQWAQPGVRGAAPQIAGGALEEGVEGLIPLALDNRRRRPALKAAWQIREHLLGAMPAPVRDLFAGDPTD